MGQKFGDVLCNMDHWIGDKSFDYKCHSIYSIQSLGMWTLKEAKLEVLQHGQGEPTPALSPSPLWMKLQIMAILSSKNVTFELENPNLVLTWDIYNIKIYLNEFEVFAMVSMWVLIHQKLATQPNN